MCGIIAIAGKETGEIGGEKIEAMLSCLPKRGPDDRGIERFEGAILGQTRLAIVDLSPAGHQPMQDNHHPLTIVFNGEIYDYKKLRADLEKYGHTFSSHSDTEVILKAYAEYGRDCVRHIDGMFAFAIWDDAKKELFVARDRFGKKPFYYAFYNDMFYSASEIKAILATGSIRGRVDPTALDDYLRLGYVPSHKTIYSNISMLPPAHAGTVKNGTLKTWCYWDLQKKKLDISYEEAKVRIKELFDTAVKKRMVADVEVGSLLSGGVDSTIVTLYAQKHSSFPIKTFAVGYEGHTNELPYAEQASKKIGTDHYSLSVDADLAHELEKIINYMDEPHGDTSNFPQHLISELAAKKVKVALTGDGADELFMGYGWYQKHAHTPRWKPKRWLLDEFEAAEKARTVFDEKERQSLLKVTTRNDEENYEQKLIRDAQNPIEKINSFDLKVYLPGQLLSKIDRTSMMHSLEVRSPFLDTDLAEFVYNLPTKFKLSKNENKIILKDILAETFPREFVYRRKQGFGAPIKEWLKKDIIREIIKELIHSESLAFQYIAKKKVIELYDLFYKKNQKEGEKLWIIYCLMLWFKTHHSHIEK